MGLWGLIKSIVRTLIIKLLPSQILKISGYPAKIAFIVNLPTTSSVPLSVPFRKSVIKIMQGLFPIVVSSLKGFNDKDDKEIKGWVILCPITAKEIMSQPAIAQRKVLKAVKLAEKIGIEIVTLGAFTSIATRDGLDLIGKTKVGITTGNVYSAVVTIQNAEKAAKLIGLNIKDAVIAIVGAAGSVGSGCAKFLIGKAKELLLIDRNYDNLSGLFCNTKSLHTEIKISSDIKIIQEADIVIVVTNAVTGIVEKQLLKSGAIIVDGANPPNISNDVIESRDDILVISSAIVKIPGLRYSFDFKLGTGEIFGCVGEAMALAWSKWTGNYALGKVEISQMVEIEELVNKAGLCIAKFRNPLGLISTEYINHIRSIKLLNKN
jgi:predicted amino acid dehydrogenase